MVEALTKLSLPIHGLAVFSVPYLTNYGDKSDMTHVSLHVSSPRTISFSPVRVVYIRM